jgi:hypothetical protein
MVCRKSDRSARSGQARICVTPRPLSGNIAWETKRERHLNNKDGKVLNDPGAMTLRDRTYEREGRRICEANPAASA